MHYHKVKEESFQILSGSLFLTLGTDTQELSEGEVATVERGVNHGFSSIKGCIFEEVSTTHVKNDSFYEDPEIAGKDLMERKTILKEW